MYYVSELQPAQVFLHPSRADFLPENRRWQGIPSMERSPGGRLFAVFYSGGDTEQNGNYIALCASDDDGIDEAYSYDQGRTWWQEGNSGLGGPSSRFFIRRLHSGNLLLVNHFDFHGRNNLMAKLSFDDGKTWVGGLMLDERSSVSYPDGTQDENGLIYITYDRERYRDREILMAAFTERDILAGRCLNEKSRLRVLISKATGLLPNRK